MPLKLSQSFSFFGGGNSQSHDGGKSERIRPFVALEMDKQVYRPGDPIIATIEIINGIAKGGAALSSYSSSAFMIESLFFEIRGIEKRDTQWFATQRPLPGSKEKRGESIFLDCKASIFVSKEIIPHEGSKSYMVRAQLPKALPPSYRGTTIRYMYYVKAVICGRRLPLENGYPHSHTTSVNDLLQLEARQPLQILGTQRTWGFNSEDNQLDENSPKADMVMDVYWREKDVDSDWVRTIESFDEPEEGYDSSKDEISSVSSYNPNKSRHDTALRTSVSLQSFGTRSYAEGRHSQADNSNSYLPLPGVSLSTAASDANNALPPLSRQRKLSSSPFSKDSPRALLGQVDTVPSEAFIRGKSYNIKLDDQVLLRFSPKSSDSAYYFGDTIGGILVFSREGAQRCLEVLITLEILETVTHQFVHPSRRNSPTITKVQSDYHAVVADLTETSFLFSIPVDGPMSFSTPQVSVQWALRFEFFTNPKNVDWRRYEHPLLIDGREKGEWVLPITVHAPASRNQAGTTPKNERSLSLGSLSQLSVQT